jgi:protein translocase SecG subunit
MFGGGGDSVFRTRRGVEKIMFQLTIAVIVLFFIMSTISVLWQA